MKRWKGFEHGINLGGWLSQCDHTKERYDNFIKEDDIKRIASWGLDHVRVPIDYNLVEDKEGNYKEDGFTYIDKAIEWTGKYGLNMILDVHKTFGYSFDFGENEEGFFDSEKYQERFYRLWENLAKRYGNIGDRVAFELLNEVTDKSYCDTWNRVASTCIDRIRAIAPDVKILYGGYWNNSIEALPDLLPPKDENVIYNFHCYEPLIFTHQGAPWIRTMDVNFRIPLASTYRQLDEASKKYLEQVTISMDEFDPDSNVGVEYFAKYFSEAVRVCEERNVALYCGEYGVIDRADPKEALAWYKMISKEFNRCGIGRAAWSYKEMDFGFIDEHMAPVFEEIIKEL